ncbi:MAG: prepilin-type N-terminal cleavage/methylation domain-containing protein [Phycisphaerales bacterium]
MDAPGRWGLARPSAATGIVFVVAAVFAWGAIMKALHPDAFGVVVWRVLAGAVTPAAAVVIGLLIACAEVALATALVFDREKGVWLRVSAALLGLFCIVLVRLSFLDDAPGCGCLSAPGVHGSGFEFAVGIVRNVALLWMIFLIESPRRFWARSHPGRGARAFALVELLVVIAVIAVVLSVALPALGHALSTSRSHRLAAQERQVFAALEMYVTDAGESYPYFGVRGDPYGGMTIGEQVLDQGDYFQTQRWYWATVLVPGYVPERSALEPAGREEALRRRGLGGLIGASAMLTSTVAADPSFFTPGPKDPGWSLGRFRGVRRTELRFPSAKGVLVSFYGGPGGEAELVGERGGYPLIFGDGSGGLFTREELDRMPTVDRAPLAVLGVHATPDGIAGRDRGPESR